MKTLLYALANGIATITLHRPEQHNAFNALMIQELLEIIEQAKNDNQVRILVLKSEGKNFSAGADLQWMQEMAEYGRAENYRDAQTLGHLLFTLYYFPKPTIVLVQGATYGGGIGLIACCHIAIATEDASFCFSEVKLGLIPAVISPYIINAIGLRQTRAYFLSANIISAQRAHQMGLCHELVPAEQLSSRAADWIHALLHNGPSALTEVNHLLNHLQPIPITPGTVTYTAQKIAQLRESSEGKEGIAAFLEKRKPQWDLEP